MSDRDKPLVWLHGEVKSPPMSRKARVEVGVLLRRIQRGESIGLPHSRPMPTVGRRCHELRINDEKGTWRIVYRLDADAIIIAEVFAKKTAKTPADVLRVCRERLSDYDRTAGGKR